MIYKFREGSRFPVRAEIAGRELERIRKANGGRVEAPTVVDSARPLHSPLHPVFEWDDSVAGERYREEQARQLVRSIEIIHDDTPGVQADPVRAYVIVKDPVEGRAYEDTKTALSDPDKKRQVLADCLTLLEGIRARYRHLTELDDVFQAIDRARARLDAAKARPKKAAARP